MSVTTDVSLVKKFLAKGANVNSANDLGETALMNSANAPPEAIEALIKAGANVNAKSKTKRTPLICAVNSYNLKAIEILLKHGADPTIYDSNGKTPYALALVNGYAPIVKAFENAGVRK